MSAFPIPERARAELAALELGDGLEATVEEGDEMTDADVDEHLLDLDAARQARDEGIARVDQHADTEWKAAAFEAVRKVAINKRLFTGDDVWATGLPKPREPRALGPVLLRASKAGIARKTGRTVASRVPKDHCNPHAEWESLIYQGGAR